MFYCINSMFKLNLYYANYIVNKYNKDGSFTRQLLPYAVRSINNTASSEKYIFYNKKYPIEMGIIDFETIINNFIEQNKKYFDKYISVIVQIENRNYIYYTVGERFPVEVGNTEDINNYIEYLRNKWEQLDKNS